MLLVNTIENLSYNSSERERLDAEYRALKTEWEKQLDAASNIDDDAQYCEECEKIENGIEREMNAKYLECFAAQFPECKNAWFCNVVSELAAGECKYLSDKQYVCFSRYVCGKDKNFWKSGKTYCRVNNNLVTITIYKGGKKTILKENLK